MRKQKKTQSRQKRLYRVKNWAEYDKAQAIQIMLTVKNVFHLSNRAAEGFIRSLFLLLKVCLPVPDHTTLSRRGKTLRVRLPKKVKGRIDIVMDSAGLKIYGEGEWKMRTHGKSKRHTWRKLHLGVDPQSGEIQAAELTEAGVSDDAMVAPLLEQIDQPIDSLAADGAYDKRKVYDALNKHAPKARALIPPRRNAHIWQHGNTKAERQTRRKPALHSQTWPQSLEEGFRLPHPFLGRNCHVSHENYLW